MITLALTLLEASKLSTDVLQRGVVETFARNSAVLEQLPFMEIEGNSYKWNVESALPTVAYRSVGQGYTENTGTVEQKTTGLVILGGDVDVDKFIVQTRGNINDIRAVHTQMKAKALSRTFTSDFFHGDSSKNPLQFDGIAAQVAGTGQDIDNVQEALTLAKLHELLDAVEGGADVLYMSKAMRRELQALLEGQQHYIQVGKDNFGRPITLFGDVEIRTFEDEILPFAKKADGTADTSEIYALKFGAMEHIAGVRNGGVSVRDLGELDTLPVFRTRIEFYAGLAIFKQKSLARLKNIKRR